MLDGRYAISMQSM